MPAIRANQLPLGRRLVLDAVANFDWLLAAIARFEFKFWHMGVLACGLVGFGRPEKKDLTEGLKHCIHLGNSHI